MPTRQIGRGRALRRQIARAAASALLALASAADAKPPGPQVTELADRFVAASLKADPTIAYLFDLPVRPSHHALLPDNSAQGRRRFDLLVDRLSRALQRVDRGRLVGEQRALHAILEEELGSRKRLRICARELWDISHYDGWLTSLPRLARTHPVGSRALRKAALARWGKLPAFIDTEIANLRRGLAAGYVVPGPVVLQALKLAEGLAPDDVADSPFHSPAARDSDRRFGVAMRSLVERSIYPALKRYSDFLANEYLPASRTSLGIAALPNGGDCYRALARHYTTSQRTPEELFEMAEAATAEGLATIRELGRRRYGITDPAEILRRARGEPSERYDSAEEMLGEARRVVAQSRTAFAPLFHSLPDQEILVEPYPPHQQGLGLDARYDHSEDPSVPATYRIPVERFAQASRAGNITTSWHEGIPGHHLVFGRRAGKKMHPLRRMIISPAYNEGWAQYAEALAQQSAAEASDTGRIVLAIGGSRPMTIDLAIHSLGWDRDRVAAFLQDRGGAGAGLDGRLERAAARPGQFLAYLPAQMEIRALRDEAERALGSRFDIRDFHEVVLEDGPVPMWFLREKVTEWVNSKQAGRRAGGR